MVLAAPALHSCCPRRCPLPQLAWPQIFQAQLGSEDNKQDSLEKNEDVKQSERTDMGKSLLPKRSSDKGDEDSHSSRWLIWCLALPFMVLIYGSYGVLMNLSKVENQIPFSSAAMNFLIETFKFLVAGLLLLVETRSSGFGEGMGVDYYYYLGGGRKGLLQRALPFAVPAVLYTVNNNLAVFMQVHMDPATYHVLGNLKIVSTAVLYRIILKRVLKTQQWISVGLLTAAGVCDSMGHMVSEAEAEVRVSQQQYITAVGLLSILTYCLISALAGVYTEFILKRDMLTSLHLQNMMLYSFSIPLNLAAWGLSRHHHSPVAGLEGDTGFEFFRGFSVYVWLSILMQVVNGLGMSVIFKLGSNLVRLFVVSCGMLVSTALSCLVLGLSLNLLYLLTLLLVIAAIFLYHH